jgi:aminopeptidase N
LTLTSCRDAPAPRVDPGVPLYLAERRAATIRDVRYQVALSIPAQREAAITGTVLVRFVLARVTEPLVLDFAQPDTAVLAVLIDGRAIDYAVLNEHIVIPTEQLIEGPNTVEIRFIAGEGSLNRQREFLYTLFVPDRARVALPVFDQPDLKARFELRLEVPASWRAVANGREVRHEIVGDRATYTFAETKPISTYLFAFAAGRFEIAAAERDGRELRMFHRETDSAKVERNQDVIFDLHATALAWLEEYTGIAYPFDKFDFVLVPSFQYGGMEHPGSILYRASSLLLDESSTQNQRLGRASLIAHETAHQWFGDLVTMTWFNDVWMKEVFANFMAAKIVNPSFPDVNHELRFLLTHYPAAYEIDRTAGANPIRQPLENLQEAGTLYGPIIYQKAPVVMGHLELLLGERRFRDGLRTYLTTYQFGNATWRDLIAILDARTEDDLVAWSGMWVEESGRPTVSARVETAGDTITSLLLTQTDPTGRGRLWNQQLEVLLGYRDAVGHLLPIRLREDSVFVQEAVGARAPDFVLPNGRGIAYGLFALDSGSHAHLLERAPMLEDPLTRAVAYLGLWDAVLERQVPPVAFVEVALRGLASETDELNEQRILAYLGEAYWRYLSADTRREWAPRVERVVWRGVSGSTRQTRRAAYFDAFRNVALTDDAVDRLTRIWREDETVPGLPLSESDFTALAEAIAIRRPSVADTVLRGQTERITNPDRRDRFEFVRAALAADSSTRHGFFESLRRRDRRAREPWVLDGVRFLHHPLRADQARGYIRPSLELLPEIQRTGDIFFPARWLDATLSGHNSPDAAAIVREFLASGPALAERLRGKVLQAADPLLRAAEIVSDSAR